MPVGTVSVRTTSPPAKEKPRPEEKAQPDLEQELQRLRNELELMSTAVNGNSSTVRVDVRDANVAGVTIVMRTPRQSP